MKHAKKHAEQEQAQLPAEQVESYKLMFDQQLPLILGAKKGEPDALAELEKLSRGLRKAKAHKFLPNRPDLHEDAVQAAWTGVLKALRKWDPRQNRLFLAYAHWDISEAIRAFKYEMETTVSRPTHMHRKLSKLAKFNTSNPDELAELSGLTEDSVRDVMALKHGDVSLHEFRFESEEDIGNRYVSSMQPFLDESGPQFNADKDDMMELLQKALRALEPREAHIIFLYYNTDSTFSQIAETMNLTRQRVEQINSSAVNKLQKFFLSKDPQLNITPRKGRTQQDGVDSRGVKALLAAISENA